MSKPPTMAEALYRLTVYGAQPLQSKYNDLWQTMKMVGKWSREVMEPCIERVKLSDMPEQIVIEMKDGSELVMLENGCITLTPPGRDEDYD